MHKTSLDIKFSFHIYLHIKKAEKIIRHNTYFMLRKQKIPFCYIKKSTLCHKVSFSS